MMNELGSVNSGSPGSMAPGNHRKERGAIAAQACETCRSRKQKCDEQRPRCSTCQRFDLDCRYREPQPTKKDKTLVEILDRLKNLEGKIDGLSISSATPSIFDPAQANVDSASVSMGIARQNSIPSSLHISDASSPSPMVPNLYRYVSSTHSMLAWPMIQQTLEPIRQRNPTMYLPLTIEQEGASISLGTFIRQTHQLAGPSIHQDSATMSNASGQFPLELSTANLSWETMRRLSKAYFDTFNMVHPILDRQTFLTHTLPSIVNSSFNEDIDPTLGYLVFALGEVAMATQPDAPNHSHPTYKGHTGGVRGGTPDRPPGLGLFNEARKRMGFNLTGCSLENVQVFILAALYYETCFRHAEFWRMSISASLACQALLSSKPGELTSPQGDVIKRVFWHCLIVETSLNLELGVPLTGLEKLEDAVGLPTFSGPLCEEDYMGNQTSHYQEHFISRIVLRRLTVESHNSLRDTRATPGFPPMAVTPPEQQPTAATMEHLASQIDQWRGLLPEALRWNDDPRSQATAAPTHERTSPTTEMIPGMSVAGGGPGSGDLFHPPSPHQPYPFAIDIQVALLRTRYYWARYLIYRPFVYKVLHHPDQMTREDASGAAECLLSCLRWPITMAPTCRNKRLVPCTFLWSQNLLGMLLILHLSGERRSLLGQIRGRLLGEGFGERVRESVGLYVDWIRDLREVDAGAGWSWGIVREVFGVEE